MSTTHKAKRHQRTARDRTNCYIVFEVNVSYKRAIIVLYSKVTSRIPFLLFLENEHRAPVQCQRALTGELQTAMEEFLRNWRQDALNKGQYDSAVYIGDKVLALTSTRNNSIYSYLRAAGANFEQR